MLGRRWAFRLRRDLCGGLLAPFDEVLAILFPYD